MITSLGTWLTSFRNIVTLDYVIDRLDFNFLIAAISTTWYEIKHPNHPWINPKMIPVMENILHSDDVGIEFGSGRSTTWLAERTSFLYSVENDKQWYDRVLSILKGKSLSRKVNLQYTGSVNEETGEGRKNYLMPISKIKDESLDYSFVDGFFRDDCILSSIQKLKHGGVLIVDNVDNYFPNKTKSISVRYKRDNFSKTVSKEKMKRIYQELDGWRCVWMSSAIQDTALWVKP